MSACLLSAVSCEKMGITVKGGDDFVFTAEAEGGESEATKATYGGDANRYSESGKTYEPIYWSVNDLVRITCAQAQGSQSADYFVSEVNSTNKMQANISLYSPSGTAIGLRWNDDTSKEHKFFAACPSPASNGACKDIDGYYVKGLIPQNGDQNTLTGALSGSNGNYVLAPDLKWQLMVANSSYTQSSFPQTGTAFLKFKPLSTAIQFTITNSVAKDLVIKELQLISDSSRISGRFDIDNMTVADTDGYPKMRLLDDAYTGQTVRIVFPDSGHVTIKQGKTFTFTFFLVPVKDVADLKFRIVRGGGGVDDGATMTTRLGYTDGTGVKFPRCKKSFVTGIMVPEGIQWAIDYAPFLTEWVDDGGEDITLN